MTKEELIDELEEFLCRWSFTHEVEEWDGTKNEYSVVDVEEIQEIIDKYRDDEIK